MRCNLFVPFDILNNELKICLLDIFFCYANLFFTYVVFNYVINYIFQLGITNFEEKMFLLLKFGKNMFLFLNLNPINTCKYSVFIKTRFASQEMQNDPKHLQLWKIHRRFSHDCYVQIAIQFLSAEVLLQFFKALSAFFALTAISPQPVFALHLLVPVIAYASHYIVYTLQWYILLPLPLSPSFLAFTIFAVIRFFVLFHSHILCLVFVNSHFEFSFQSF